MDSEPPDNLILGTSTGLLTFIISFIGSEDESDASDVDEVVPLIPRVFRATMETPDDEEPREESPPPLPISPPHQPSPPRHNLSVTSKSNIEPSNYFNFMWSSFPNPPIPSELRRESFSDTNVGPTISYADPYDIFVGIWDRQFMEYIASECNKYAQQVVQQLIHRKKLRPNSRICDWKDTSADELYVYFAILLAMGIVAKGRVVDYWSVDANIFITPGFRVYIYVFEALSTALQVSSLPQ